VGATLAVIEPVYAVVVPHTFVAENEYTPTLEADAVNDGFCNVDEIPLPVGPVQEKDVAYLLPPFSVNGAVRQIGLGVTVGVTLDGGPL
jgi:hypothetical protein